MALNTNWRLIIDKILYTVPKVIDFKRYNIKCSGENVILRGIFHVVSGFPLHFMLFRGNLDYFLYSVLCIIVVAIATGSQCKQTLEIYC